MYKSKEFNVITSKYNTWEEVFSNPSSISVKTLNTGIIKCPVRGLINDGSDTKSLAKIPVLSHLITHEELGNYLIDTGFDSSFSTTIGGRYKGLIKMFYFKNTYMQNSIDEGIDKQTLGLDIKSVFLTHMHEHGAGSIALSDDISYVFGRGEKEVSVFPFVYSQFLKNKKNLFYFDFNHAKMMPIVGKCIDVFGDASLWAISTPGHTPGHVSYLVNAKSGPILITGDVSMTKKGHENRIEPGSYDEDKTVGKETFLKLLEFTNKYPNIKIIFGHETDEFPIEYL